MLNARGTCPATNFLRAGRRGRPRRLASRSSRAAAARARNGPRLSSTMFSMFGGRGVEELARSWTNSSWSTCSAWLERRSKPIVDDAFELMPAPQSEPATWPGRARRRRGARAASAGSRRGRSRPRSPRWPDRAAPRRRPAASRRDHEQSSSRSTTTKQQCSGRCPGVCRTRILTSPSEISSRPRAGRADTRRSAAGWTRPGTPCSSASRPCPETWSACVCVSRTRVIRTCRSPPRRGTARSRTRDRRPRPHPRTRRRSGRRRSRDRRRRTGETARQALTRPRRAANRTAADMSGARHRLSEGLVSRGGARSPCAGLRSCPRRSPGSSGRGRAARSPTPP